MRLLKDEIGKSESIVCRKMNEFTDRNNAAIDAFMAKGPQRTEAAGRICGYDPMNQIRVGDKLFAKHFLMLQVGDKQETLMKFMKMVIGNKDTGLNCNFMMNRFI